MSTPGLMLPTQKGMLGANPKESSLMEFNNTNTKTAALSNAVGGKRRKRRGGAIAVPQFQMQYNSTSGPGTDPNAQVAALSQTSTQGAANAQFDSDATKMGGKSRRHRRKTSRRRKSSRRKTKRRRM